MSDWIIIQRYLQGASIEQIEAEFKHSFRTQRNRVRIEGAKLQVGAYDLAERLTNMDELRVMVECEAWDKKVAEERRAAGA